jgi:prepilin-type N-terminal cleavage/methylation domain-containing protein
MTPYHFYYVYILKSLSYSEQLYIGFTTNLRKRLSQHNNGENISTNRYRPWRLFYFEAFSDEKMARNRELSLKNNGNPMRELKKRTGIFSEHKSDKGFTLIEVIIYIAIFGILFGGAVMASYNLFESNERNVTKSMLEDEGEFLLGKISWVTTGISSISSPAVNTTSNSLTVTKWDTSIKNPVVVTQVGNAMTIRRGTGPEIILNNSNTNISGLLFTHTYDSGNGQKPESITVNFTLSALTPNGIAVSQDFTDTIFIRK